MISNKGFTRLTPVCLTAVFLVMLSAMAVAQDRCAESDKAYHRLKAGYDTAQDKLLTAMYDQIVAEFRGNVWADTYTPEGRRRYRKWRRESRRLDGVIKDLKQRKESLKQDVWLADHCLWREDQ